MISLTCQNTEIVTIWILRRAAKMWSSKTKMPKMLHQCFKQTKTRVKSQEENLTRKVNNPWWTKIWQFWLNLRSRGLLGESNRQFLALDSPYMRKMTNKQAIIRTKFLKTPSLDSRLLTHNFWIQQFIREEGSPKRH